MSASKYLAIDFGAESGRVIVGILENNKIRLEEVHRFANRQVKVQGRLYWDVLYLFDELKKGLSEAVNKGHKDINSIGIDTWGVDFGLLDKFGQLIGNPVAYRDSRTDGMMDRAFKMIPKKEIYDITGIQFMKLNTIFQFLSMVEEDNPQLKTADKLLFMPDLFAYMLTGSKIAEYSIASTAQLLHAENKTWASEVFNKLNLPINLMPEVVNPGTTVGQLSKDICLESGMGAVNVVAPAGHDTACAVAAVPAHQKNWAYLSSGTWSLLGIESDKPIINDLSFKYGFTNEGGVKGKIRFLKNIMGMWLLEQSRRTWKKKGLSVEYDILLKQAADSEAFVSVINPDDSLFLNPSDMPAAIEEFCIKTKQAVPKDTGAFTRCIFESLAFKYRYVLEMINEMLVEKIEVLHVVGGGSKNNMLNQYIANALGISVIAGPVEGTALGNIMMQAITDGQIKDLDVGRKLIADSFEMEHFQPQNHQIWDDMYQKNKTLLG